MIGRIDKLLDKDDLETIQALLDDADWVSGQQSAGAQAALKKTNMEMDQRCEQWKKINELVVNQLYAHPEFQRVALPHKVSAAFVARYTSGHAYGGHIDDPVMGHAGGRYRSDIACTVFLNDPEAYEGGELVVMNRYGPQSFKLDAGSAIVYPASSLHEVSMIRSGERTVCALWAQSLVRDAHQREILAELGDARAALQMQLPDAKVTNSVDIAYANLVRLWAEV